MFATHEIALGLLAAVIFTCLIAWVYVWFSRRSADQSFSRSRLKELMHKGEEWQSDRERSKLKDSDLDSDILEEIKKQTRRSNSGGKRRKLETFDDRLMKAGYISETDKLQFAKKRLISAVVGFMLGSLMVFLIGINLIGGLVGLVFLIVGLGFPNFILARKIKRRYDDIMFFLPMIIEQLQIGVASSLDIGPSIKHIVEMATSRRAHNVVTEMLHNVRILVLSGFNLEDALEEVGHYSKCDEVNHTFMFLAQCSRYGGELSSQIEELANTISEQRNTLIEGKIAALPVKATIPLVMVFFGFFIFLVGCIATRIKEGLSGVVG